MQRATQKKTEESNLVFIGALGCFVVGVMSCRCASGRSLDRMFLISVACCNILIHPI